MTYTEKEIDPLKRLSDFSFYQGMFLGCALGFVLTQAANIAFLHQTSSELERGISNSAIVIESQDRAPPDPLTSGFSTTVCPPHNQMLSHLLDIDRCEENLETANTLMIQPHL